MATIRLDIFIAFMSVSFMIFWLWLFRRKIFDILLLLEIHLSVLTRIFIIVLFFSHTFLTNDNLTYFLWNLVLIMTQIVLTNKMKNWVARNFRCFFLKVNKKLSYEKKNFRIRKSRKSPNGDKNRRRSGWFRKPRSNPDQFSDQKWTNHGGIFLKFFLCQILNFWI